MCHSERSEESCPSVREILRPLRLPQDDAVLPLWKLTAVLIEAHRCGSRHVVAVGQSPHWDLHDVVQQLQNIVGQSRALVSNYKGCLPFELKVVQVFRITRLFEAHEVVPVRAIFPELAAAFDGLRFELCRPRRGRFCDRALPARSKSSASIRSMRPRERSAID